METEEREREKKSMIKKIRKIISPKFCFDICVCVCLRRISLVFFTALPFTPTIPCAVYMAQLILVRVIGDEKFVRYIQGKSLTILHFT